MAADPVQVVLHIGGEKTGTSTLQQWCYENQLGLEFSGVLYPRCLGRITHARLTCFAARQAPIVDLMKAEGLFDPAMLQAFRLSLPALLADEIARSGCSRILVSNEHLSSRLIGVDELEQIKALFEQSCGSKVNWRIVLYVRRQDELLQSMYSTTIKSGGTHAFKLRFDLTDPRLNPLVPLELWESVFGHEAITVRVFDRAVMIGGDIVQDLMPSLGIADAADRRAFVSVPENNQRLGGVALEFLRRFNEHIPVYDDFGWNRERFGVVQALEQLAERDSQHLATPEALASLMKQYEGVNAEIARRYLARMDGVLYADAPSGTASTRQADFDADAAIRIAAHLWRYKQKGKI